MQTGADPLTNLGRLMANNINVSSRAMVILEILEG